jgi:hypothetical protein
MRKKNKGFQESSLSWNPHRPGRLLSPAVHCLLLEIGSMPPKSLNGIGKDPRQVDIKATFFLSKREYIVNMVSRFNL